MRRRPPRTTRTDTLVSYPTLVRSWGQVSQPTFWRGIGRNKYSGAADLRSEQGQHLARQLIARADILVENFRPGTLERWNLAPEDLQRDNPGLIVVRVSGYGQTGPYSARAGFGGIRSEEHTTELQSLMRISYAVLCLKKK